MLKITNGGDSMYLSKTFDDAHLGLMKWFLFLVVFVSLAVGLPYACHSLGNIGGRALLPMHFVVITAALIMGTRGGIATALLSPSISFALSGMPLAVVPMTLELTVYAFVVGILFHTAHRSLFLSLIIAMLAGRIVSLLFVTLIGATPLTAHLYTMVVVGLPGMILQLFCIPFVVRMSTRFLNTQ